MAADVMMVFGDFVFSIDTAAYQELERTTKYRWSKSDVIGAAPVRQFVGPGGDDIVLSGLILPHFRGGFGQLDRLREIAGTGEPQFLVAGTGQVSGEFTLSEIQETQTEFSHGGRPALIRFTLNLSRYEALS